MHIIWLLSVILVCGAPAWAADPPSSGQREHEPNPPSEETVQGPQPESPDISRARRQLQEIDRRLSVLESVVVGRGHERGVIERGLGWSPEQQERGFALYSTDGNYRLHLNGGVQVDYHAFPKGQTGQDPGTEPDGFVVRRLRPILDFRIAKEFRGQIMPDLTSKFPLFNAFLDWDRFDWARIRVGQFKPVFNVENQQGEFDLVFAERSFVQNFAIRRSFGVQLTGRGFGQRLRYDFGVFDSNNGIIGAKSRPEPSADDNKIGYTRLMLTPFLREGPQALRKLDVGIGFSYGSCRETACQQPMQTMGQDRVIFQYNSTVTGDGFHSRLLPQMTWYWERLGVMSTFIHTWEPKVDRATGAATTLQNQAWMVMAEFALTDDEPSFNRVTPKKPFDLSKPGHWGAWTISARYSEQRLDAATFGLNYGDATRYARSAKGFSAGLTWYASREFRFQNIWEHTDLKGADGRYAASGTDDMLIFRATLLY